MPLPKTSPYTSELVQKQLGAVEIKTKLVSQEALDVLQNVTMNQRDFQIAVTDPGYVVDPDYRLRIHTTAGR